MMLFIVLGFLLRFVCPAASFRLNDSRETAPQGKA
jgi:hypothetical protein